MAAAYRGRVTMFLIQWLYGVDIRWWYALRLVAVITRLELGGMVYNSFKFFASRWGETIKFEHDLASVISYGKRISLTAMLSSDSDRIIQADRGRISRSAECA